MSGVWLSWGAGTQDAQEACPGRQVAGWDKARPAGVSKIDLTAVWGHAPTPLAGAGPCSESQCFEVASQDARYLHN